MYNLKLKLFLQFLVKLFLQLWLVFFKFPKIMKTFPQIMSKCHANSYGLFEIKSVKTVASQTSSIAPLGLRDCTSHPRSLHP